jgi:two-component system nitrogen regulation response regulator GlnG
MHVLESHSWPGNVRELQMALKYAFVQATGDVITADCLPLSVRFQGARGAASGQAAQRLSRLAEEARSRIQNREANLYHRMHAELERVLLEESLREAAGNQVLASKLLGISRTTLRAKLDRLSDASRNNPRSDPEQP